MRYIVHALLQLVTLSDHYLVVLLIKQVKAAGGVMTSFESWCGGLPAPEAADNPLGYKFRYKQPHQSIK
jgi:hypothetical protein